MIKINKVEGPLIGIGIAFIVYGGGIIFNFISKENRNEFLTGLSVAGIFLVLTELIDFFEQRFKGKLKNIEETGTKSVFAYLMNKFIQLSSSLRLICYIAFGLSMIVLPGVLVKYFSELASRLNDSTSVAALGFTILLIAAKNSVLRRKQKQELERNRTNREANQGNSR